MCNSSHFILYTYVHRLFARFSLKAINLICELYLIISKFEKHGEPMFAMLVTRFNVFFA